MMYTCEHTLSTAVRSVWEGCCRLASYEIENREHLCSGVFP